MKIKYSLKILLSMVMLSSIFCSSAFALSSYDQKNLSSAQQKAVESAQKAWGEANAKGDKAGMEAAHKAAESVRNSAGYSGGSDGGFYIPNSSSSASSSSSSTSSSSSSSKPSSEVAKQFVTITASASDGGSINPNGSFNVAKGSNKDFSITANKGYKIDKVMIDGISVGSVSSYTLSNITTNHTIAASFVPSGRVDITKAEVSDKYGKASMKSGYGIYANINTDYLDVDNVKVTASYNFGKKTEEVSLVEISKNKFGFKENIDSPTKERCVYVPVETKDKNYVVTFKITGINAKGNLISASKTATITIKGNMHEDDFTKDRY